MNEISRTRTYTHACVYTPPSRMFLEGFIGIRHCLAGIVTSLYFTSLLATSLSTHLTRLPVSYLLNEQRESSSIALTTKPVTSFEIAARSAFYSYLYSYCISFPEIPGYRDRAIDYRRESFRNLSYI